MCDVCGSRIEYIKLKHERQPISQFAGESYNFCLISHWIDQLKDQNKVVDLNNFLTKSCGCVNSRIEEEYCEEQYERLFKVVIMPGNTVCMGNGNGINI
jgi:hypothetical protein